MGRILATIAFCYAGFGAAKVATYHQLTKSRLHLLFRQRFSVRRVAGIARRIAPSRSRAAIGGSHAASVAVVAVRMMAVRVPVPHDPASLY